MWELDDEVALTRRPVDSRKKIGTVEFSPVPRSSCISLVSPGWITVPRMLMAYSASLLTVIFAVCIPRAREPSFLLNWPVRMTARGVLSLVLSALTTPSVFSFSVGNEIFLGK
uniref:Uncharacterized protein n=1 Tax=Klebsiella pneumoniae TaxID=573 RepID=A0A8B0SV42_KLEPN|nr:hypothetical protein [Klebsiella pneumoniae]